MNDDHKNNTAQSKLYFQSNMKQVKAKSLQKKLLYRHTHTQN